MDHTTSHKGNFFEIEISISKLSIDAWFVRIGQYLAEVQLKNAKKKLRKLPVKWSKFLATHITNQKLGFDIFMVGNLQNIFMEHDLYLIS